MLRGLRWQDREEMVFYTRDRTMSRAHSLPEHKIGGWKWQEDKTGKMSKDHDTNSFICHLKKDTLISLVMGTFERF